jgi:hypothetical protein
MSKHSMSKQSMREESERPVREAMAKKSVTVKHGDTALKQSAESAEHQIVCRRPKEQTVPRSPARNADTSKRHCEFANPRVAAASFAE